MGMNVKVEQGCDRCKRKELIDIDSDLISALQSAEKRRAETHIKIEEFFKSLGADMPDLVTLFMGEVQITSSICSAHCVSPVKNQLENVFREAKPRAPRTKKGEAVDVTPEAVSSADAAAAPPVDEAKTKRKNNTAPVTA